MRHQDLVNEPFPYIHRDISWLSFNYRVLQEAKDPTNPLFERIKFLAIYSNNIGEFFQVRMATNRNLLRAGKKTKRQLDFDPKLVIKEILNIANRQQEEYSEIFENQIIPELKGHGIHLLRRLELNDEQLEFVEDYFNNHMLPFVQPVLLVKHKIRPFLNNSALYLAVLLHDKELEKDAHQFAIVKIPSDHLPRFIELPSPANKHHIIMLDDIVRHSLAMMFPGYDILNSFSIKLTRDAELYIDDEFSGELITKIKKSLIKRHVGPATRFVYDREMPGELLEFLMETFDLDKYDLVVEGRYHNNFDFFKFPTFGMDYLKNTPLPPLPYPPLSQKEGFFEAIQARDHLLNFPYHDYEPVVRFFEEAAADPLVTHIKIVQYRVSKKSRIMEALKKAVKAGKQVFVFIEVKARFDEANNLEWGEQLEQAGIKVHYSFPGVKVHAKIALVCRSEANKPAFYAYLSTGNFHEDTAKIYSDFGLFTTDTRLTSEVARLFNYLETVKVPAQDFEHLLVGQFNLRQKLTWLIDREIENARSGLPAKIILKLNSLQDQQMIEKLYEASEAGVKIQLIIRGICCLVPGIEGFSRNIEAISIVDRYLEHARVFIFHNAGNEEFYLSSADWMVRNLSHRIETAFPVYDEDIKAQIRDIIQLQLLDNVKARILDEEQHNAYRKDGSDLAIQSQIETYYYFKRKTQADPSLLSEEADMPDVLPKE
ncbi:MAG: polyphosphate kinase 1 [Bacteroidetes bacterium]|nr:MAG: polyphosphate kinase 1 [Bacteroidota bacterium]